MHIYQWLKSYPIMKKMCYTAEKLEITVCVTAALLLHRK